MFRYFSILIISALVLTACAESDGPTSGERPLVRRPETDTTHVKLNIIDKERVQGKDNYGNVLRIPYSVMNIEVKGGSGRKTEIGKFDGRAMRVIAINENGFPDSTILAYRCFFSSRGTDIAVTKNGSRLYIMLRNLSDLTRRKENFRIVDTIQLSSTKPVDIK